MLSSALQAASEITPLVFMRSGTTQPEYAQHGRWFCRSVENHDGAT
jgi:hypothetical protein